MCGITGIVNLTAAEPVRAAQLRQMLAMIRHRGPDQFGLYVAGQVGLGSARLSIIDLAGGQQPITNEAETLWIVFNGEIFNYVDLRPELVARGHRFTTQSDTEVILHLYEECGPKCLHYLNGQFAMAIWDSRAKTLFLARDRLGIRPLFYTLAGGALIFGSEVKAILADRRVRAQIDPLALAQVFTYWSVQPPRTIFRDIVELPAGHYLLANGAGVTLERYWQLSFPELQAGDGRAGAGQAVTPGQLAGYQAEFSRLLVDATQIRLRADVPVGAYLSGGLDSSTISAIVRQYSHNRLDTFSITFDDPAFDERAYQSRMAAYLGTQHHLVRASYAQIGQVFPQVIWHTETPLLRTAPAPLFLLAQLVRQHQFKVVLTGEGADEFLAGYDIFKEAKVRRFWARAPGSRLRPRLLQRLYPDITQLAGSNPVYLASFFGQGLTEVAAADYSHAIRWRNTRRTHRFLADELRQAVNQELALAGASLAYPPAYHRWGSLQQAQYLEITTFLSPYLLSSQGDRMSMAHAVEGRFPFLDHRLVEFCNNLPASLKLRGLQEKYLLKQVARPWLPAEIWQRPKRPYRAPIQRSFFNEARPAYVAELLSPRVVAAYGLFKPAAVGQLVNKVQAGGRLSETDEMALVGILSAQLVYEQFVANFSMPPPLSAGDPVKVCLRQPAVQL